jgi:hypothetical protein
VSEFGEVGCARETHFVWEGGINFDGAGLDGLVACQMEGCSEVSR